jgi:hypothetical protein
VSRRAPSKTISGKSIGELEPNYADVANLLASSPRPMKVDLAHAPRGGAPGASQMIPPWIRTIGRPLLPRSIRQRMNAHLDWLELRLGRKIWPTKDVGFWVMMELLLLKTRPRCIAEFGSGRSTSVLAGYAHARGADFFGFEDNAAFVRRVRAGLHGALLPSHYVHHAKITALSGAQAWRVGGLHDLLH